MLQDEEHQQQYGVQDLRQLVAGRRVHFQGSTRPQGNDPLLLFVEGSRNINNILSPPFPPPLLLSAPPPPPPPPPPSPPPPPPHHHHSYQYYDNLSNINSILGGHHLQVGGGGVGEILESTPPPPPCHRHGNHGWNINNVSEGDGNGNGTNSRWPRQETLTLLEIRSRLDPKFKEANQKAPLWDEVSRIMGEEHGYYRSGKKCREKFENLYKYYKKTKEGKAGRQDGKHYRFFRQLEALYGETSTTFPPQLINYTTTTITPSNWSTPPPPNHTTEDHDDQEPLSIQENEQQSLSTNFSNTTTTSQEFDQYQTTTSSSENNNNIDIKMNNNDDQDLSAIACSMMMNRSSSSGKSLAAHDEVIKNRKKKSSYNWKVEKVKGFVELEMRRLVEAQEVWMERMVRMIEDKEKERVRREEEWTKQEVARLDWEHEVWAKERAWMEARDACFLDTFKKYTAKFTQAAGNNSASSTSCFDEDMLVKHNNLSCVGTGSSSKLAKLHEGQELWSSNELKKEMMMNKEKKPLLYK